MTDTDHLSVPRSDLHAVLTAALDLGLGHGLTAEMDRLVAAVNLPEDYDPDTDPVERDKSAIVAGVDLHVLLPRFQQVLDVDAPTYAKERVAEAYPELDQHYRVLHQAVGTWLIDHPEADTDATPEEVSVPALGIVELAQAYGKLHPVASGHSDTGTALAALAHTLIPVTGYQAEMLRRVFEEVSRELLVDDDERAHVVETWGLDDVIGPGVD